MANVGDAAKQVSAKVGVRVAVLCGGAVADAVREYRFELIKIPSWDVWFFVYH